MWRVDCFSRPGPHEDNLPKSLPGSKNDNSMLSTILALKKSLPENEIILVSKDINLRIKATILGIKAEDYTNDKVVDDLDLLFSGTRKLPDDFWQVHEENMESWQADGKSYYEVESLNGDDWYPNQFLYLEQDFEATVRNKNESSYRIEVCQNYYSSRHAVWGYYRFESGTELCPQFTDEPGNRLCFTIGQRGHR